MFVNRRPGCVWCSAKDSEVICPIHSPGLFFSSQQFAREEFFGSAPAPFVGRFGYPCLNVGILAPPEITEQAWLYDAPRHWAAQGYTIPRIASYRALLINSRFKAEVRGAAGRLMEVSREVGIAAQPVDVEVKLSKKPSLRMSFSPHTAPFGPAADLKKVEVASNPRVPVQVEKVYSDTDWKAGDAISYLYKGGFDENYIMRILSVGALGLKVNRKLVPTRWAITATDDTLGKGLMAEIRDFPLADYQLYFGSYLGNYYLLLFFPEPWSYELFEAYTGSPRYSTDYESLFGRKSYASATAGGYYTVRLAALEQLRAMKRQAGVLAIRLITAEYSMPLGVWVTREAARKALSSAPLPFRSREEMLSYARDIARKSFGYDISRMLNSSLLLRQLKQRKLSSFG